jgi:hypothetical protein
MTAEAIVSAMCGASGKLAFSPVLLQDWFALSLLALGVSALLIGLMYLFSIIFSNPNLNMFAKFELFELGASAIIILAVLAVMAMTCTIDVGKIFPNTEYPDVLNGNIYQVSTHYLEAIDSRLIGWMTANQLVSILVDQLASTTIYAKPLGVGLVTSPGAGIGAPIKSIVNQSTSALAVAFIINHAQLAVLEFAFVGLLNYYLPIGILLRSFTPTRRFGGAILALVLGFMVIYPIMLVVSAEVIFPPVQAFDKDLAAKIGTSASSPDDYSFAGLSKQMFGDSYAQKDYQQFIKDSLGGDAFAPKVVPGSVPAVPAAAPGASPTAGASPVANELGLWEITKNIFTLSAPGKFIIYLFISAPASTIAMAFAACFLVPALNILIFVQAIKSLSKTLGEEIDVTVLTRLI